MCLTAKDGQIMVAGRVMALDVGKVRIGVALSDPLGHTAQPLLTLWRKSRGEDLRSLLRLIRKHEVGTIVVGNPLHLSGNVSAWAAKVVSRLWRAMGTFAVLHPRCRPFRHESLYTRFLRLLA